MPGEEVPFEHELNVLSEFLDAINRLGSQNYRFEATATHLLGPGQEELARSRDLEQLSTSPSMRRLQSLKAKWSLPQ